jgi:hypothetical protein
MKRINTVWTCPNSGRYHMAGTSAGVDVTRKEVQKKNKNYMDERNQGLEADQWTERKEPGLGIERRH